MDNPFALIFEKLTEIDKKVSIQQPIEPAAEIIDRKELMRRLKISEPTAIMWERKKKIPSFKIGSAIRYNWHKVLKALEGK